MDNQLVIEMKIVDILSSAVNEAAKVAREMAEKKHPDQDIFIRIHQVIPTVTSCVVIFNYDLS